MSEFKTIETKTHVRIGLVKKGNTEYLLIQRAPADELGEIVSEYFKASEIRTILGES